MFFIFLQIKMYINQTNQEHLAQLSYSKPVFILFFSRFCGHCRKVYPTWTDLMNKYENDDDVILAETDCVQNPETCKYFMTIDGYPTFAYIVNNEPKEVNLHRAFPDFVKFVEKLKQYSPTIPCRMWFPRTLMDKFPFFIYNSTLDFKRACNELRETLNENIIRKYNVLINPSNDHDGIEVRYTNDQGINLNEQLKDDSVSSVIKEYGHMPLENFNPKMLHSIKRRVAILLYKEKRHVNQYQPLANRQARHFHFTKLHCKNIEKVSYIPGISKENIPAILFSDPKKKKFLMKVKQFPNQLEDHGEINKIANGVYDKDMKEFTIGFLTSQMIITFILIFLGIIAALLIITILFARFYHFDKRLKRNYSICSSFTHFSIILSSFFCKILRKMGIKRKPRDDAFIL